MAIKVQNYHEEQRQKNTLRLRKITTGLPPFVEGFFKGITQTCSIRTRIAYAYDLRIFFNYLKENHRVLKAKPTTDFVLEDLNEVTSEDLECYLHYLEFYTKTLSNGEIIEYQNDETGKSRKLATVRTMYSYFYKKRLLEQNPAGLVDMPKVHEKTIVKLDTNEIYKLLDEVEFGEHLTDRQKIYHKHTKIRDFAIISLLLGTGIRVSECVGINIKDIDFNANGVKITRKGGNESVVYFGDEVREALLDYLEERKKVKPHTGALFLSMQNTRINVRTVQCLVKKYSNIVTKVKNISPHKLRSTYGTNLYNATGDIYLVADVLGHKDVNTTRRHYARIDDERRKYAARFIKLREKKAENEENMNNEIITGEILDTEELVTITAK